ncbi:MAG: class I SAM-dependent methyltransferase [Luteibaculaceae bacterium]
MEVLEECPVCSCNKFVKRYKVKDYLVSGEEFFIMSCSSCGLHFTNPRPAEGDISLYYDSKNYISHTDSADGFINSLYKKVREYTTKKKIDLITALNHGKKGSLLDIGCGSGFFIERAMHSGWNVLGVEPDEKARVYVQSKNIPVKPIDALPHLRPDSFEVITLWHVLEHTHNPNEILKLCRKMLRPGGCLIVAVPNRLSYDAQFYKSEWAAFDVPRHLYHFSKKNIFQLAEKNNLKVVKIMPMLFDSFYVSLISEKHRKGNMLKGFLVGALSNIVGIFKKEYSSHIYILKYSEHAHEPLPI